MTCSYCGSRNSEEESRCRRCGRRPGDSLNNEFSARWTNGALATQMDSHPQVATENRPAELQAIPGQGRREPNMARAVQGSLFWEKPVGKVIPFESFPSGPAARPRPRSTTQKTAAKPAQRRSRVPEGQGTLDFLPPAPPKPRTLGTTVEAVIYCEDPVATRLHRAVAAALDWSMVMLAYGLFLTVFALMGGQFVLTNTNIAMLGGVLPLLGCLYGLMWAISGNETAGMRWANLRLSTFDGDRPERRQRIMRFLGSCLSFATVVGLLWSFADEESLAWADHISRTFPTPRRVDSQVFHRG